MAKRAEYKKWSYVGPGGIHCRCCAPAPGKARRQAQRAWRKREKNAVQRQINKEAP